MWKKIVKLLCLEQCAIIIYMNIAAIITSLALVFMGFAGGGGSDSGGSSFDSGSSFSSSSDGSGDADVFSLFELVIILIVLIIAGIKGSKDPKSVPDKYNSTPEEKQIHEQAEQIFKSYQADWTNFNYEGIKKYTTDHYYTHASLMLELLENMHRTNKVSQLNVSRVSLQNGVNSETPLPANVSVTFLFHGLDEVITDDNQTLYSQYVSNATETWNFIYDGKNLKLAGISQPTESAPHLVRSLANFAESNQLFYSPDWGRYALPARGLIFGGASMKIADINNHIIGKWALKNSTKNPEENASKSSATTVNNGLLIQLYTYAPTSGQATSSYYVVGQINVPKNYLGVIVKSRKFKTKNQPDKSYEKFEMEWGEFNKRYEVYAASRDALPAFELLNPKFMEFLYAKNPSYNLEVVDNVIYIYANIENVTEADYADMLEVLQKAYDELRM